MALFPPKARPQDNLYYVEFLILIACAVQQELTMYPFHSNLGSGLDQIHRLDRLRTSGLDSFQFL